MCLITNSNKLFLADIDIICYKILFRCPDNVYLTPYRLNYIKLNSIIYAEGKVEFRYSEVFGNYSISKGLIHAYTTVGNARYYIATSNLRYYGAIVVKGIIPKGTSYIIDVDKAEIAARKMILIKEV